MANGFGSSKNCSSLFEFAVYLANSLGYSLTHSPRQRQYSLLYAPDAVETNCSDVQYSAPCSDQSPDYSVTIASVYKVKFIICLLNVRT